MNYNTIQTSYFKLLYPETWKYELLDNKIHSFYKPNGNDAFQISSFHREMTEPQFDLDEWKEEYENSVIQYLGETVAIKWISSTEDHKTINWLLEKDYLMLYCTYTISKHYTNYPRQKNEIKEIIISLASIELM